MVPPVGFPRLWFAAGLILSLGTCALPRSGPDYAEITAPASPDLHFDVVRVTPAVAAATRIDERLGFAKVFVEARVENTATVAPGDVMAITVWENIDQGLLNPQGIGATPLRIMLRHILPQLIAPLLVLSSVLVGATIVTEAALSFLGLGANSPENPTWGFMLFEAVARGSLDRFRWMSMVPGIAITLTVLSFNLLGDALRDILDPRLRGTGAGA